MASGTLYTFTGSLRAAKILIAAEYSGAHVTVDKSFEFGKTNKSNEFLKKFPLGKVPAFEGSDGKCLFETDAIAQYVSNEQLKGQTPLTAALVRQYTEFSNNEITPSASTWTYPCLGYRQYNKQDTESAKEHLKKCFAALNDILSSRTFLVGERVTLADISLCCDLVLLYKLVLDPSFRGPYGNLNRWFLTCVNQPQFKTILGEVALCETMAQFDSKRYQELHPKEGKKGKEKDNQGAEAKQEKEKEKPKKEQSKKDQPKKQEEPESKDEDPLEDEEVHEKKNDPFAAFPKPTMVFDEWKKMYSNNECSVSIPWLWSHLDYDNYSFWHATYNYNKDLTLGFMASNLVGGMFQRLETLRKNAFGVLNVFGEDRNLSISGIWMFRGPQLAFDLNEDWQIDSPSYSHRKLDPRNEADKKLISEHFTGENVDGVAVRTCKVYK